MVDEIDNEKQRRDLCARVFLEPQRFDAAVRLIDSVLLRSRLHIHTDILQLDVALNCGGSVICDGQSVPVKTISAFAFYPNAQHSHSLEIISPDTEVLTLKLGVDVEWPAIKHRAFASVCHSPLQTTVLIRSFRRLAWLSATRRNHSLAALTTLSELISLWPGADSQSKQPSGWVEAKGRLDSVLRLIDQNLSSPPSVEAMAKVAAVSPRQLLRQFDSIMGCTPHDYVTNQRVARAKEMLASGEMNVTEVAAALGFPSIHGFSRWFLRESKINPSEFRNQPSTL